MSASIVVPAHPGKHSNALARQRAHERDLVTAQRPA